uniref:Uncharacterized protein n=1 Tax=Brassica oleracea TaxID=3712 RepID=A0A3P6EC92_BRAOL|nr:unnamed protein product [Brassica oleracea]
MAGEDFQSRVERIFGSLAFSRSASSTTSTSSAPPLRQTQWGSVWSLSGAEVEKREWKREQLASYDREEMPCASSLDEILRQQRISSTDRKEGEEASMGLDRTLDDEVRISFQLKVLEFSIFIVNSRRLKDEYDKVALGKEDGGKGVSMEDAISRPCGVRVRDPHANHAAAKMRLKEDELEANK